MSLITISDRWGWRGGTAANLVTVNEAPLVREAVIETDTGKFKVGDGSTAWNSLLYVMRDDTLTLSDIATNNASATKHGFLKKLSNVATEYMDGTGLWSVPPGVATPTGTGLVGVTSGVQNAAAVTIGAGLDLTAGVLTAPGGSSSDTVVTKWNSADKSASITLTGSDLIATKTAAGDAWVSVRATKCRYTGKWYFEVVVTAASTLNSMVGLAADTDLLSNFIGGGTAWGGMSWFASGSSIYRANATHAIGSSYAAGDVLRIAYDADAQKLWLGKNSSWLNSGDPAAGTKAAMCGVWPGLYPSASMFTGSSGISLTGRFARAAMGHTIPAGFAPWDND